MRTFLSLILICSYIGANAQAWEYSKEFGTDIWLAPIEHDIKIIDCSKGRGDGLSVGRCMRQDVANYMDNPTFIKGYTTNTNGLYGKVSREVEAQRPKRTTTSSSRVTASSMSEARRTGKNYNHATSASGTAWRAQKAAERQESIRRAQERKRELERQRRIEDDRRAAIVTAETNARLQRETDQHIQRDYYNANEGAIIAQQRARQAHKTVGPQFKRQQTSNSKQAQMLRGQNKPRRVMYPKRSPQNTSRKPLAQVKRTPTLPQQDNVLKQAVSARTDLRQKTATYKNVIIYKGIKMSDHAVSTIGSNWRSDDMKTTPLAPPPITRSKPTYKEPSWLTEHKRLIEFLGDPPLTQEEELQLLKDREFLSIL